jgi:hypothetical protein
VRFLETEGDLSFVQFLPVRTALNSDKEWAKGEKRVAMDKEMQILNRIERQR